MADRTGLGRRLAKVRASVKANAYVPLFKYEDALLENKVNYDRADVLERERDTLRAEVAALSADLENVQTENDQRAIEVAALKPDAERWRAHDECRHKWSFSEPRHCFKCGAAL